MRSVATIFLLALLVFTQTPAGQLLKMPLLIEHFYKHQKTEGISLVEFLEDHYANDHNDADLPEDEQLPFKSTILHSIGNALVPGFIKSDFPLSFHVARKVSLQELYSPQQHLCSIFHPPRV